MSKFWGCIGLHWSYKTCETPYHFQTWGCWSCFTPGLRDVPRWTLWPAVTTRGHCPCACPGRVKLSVPWKLIGWNWPQLTTARAGHWSTPLYTGTHPKVVLGLIFDRHDLIPWAGCFSGWNVCVCERKMSTSSLALPKEDLRLWYKELTDCF